jgi:hypothetical protein
MLSFIAVLLRDVPKISRIVSFEKEIPCTCCSIHCDRYHGLPRINGIVERQDVAFSGSVGCGSAGHEHSRTTALYSSSGMPRGRTSNRDKTTHWLPCYTGESKPEGYRRAAVVQNNKGEMVSKFPTVDSIRRLVVDCGYNGRAAYAVMVRAHMPWRCVENPAGRVSTKTGRRGGGGFATNLPYAPDAPRKKTSRYKLGYKRETVMARIRCHEWSDAHASAVYEVMCLGRDAVLVAASLGLKAGTVRQHVSQIKREIGREML